jgi:hypothetical protein
MSAEETIKTRQRPRAKSIDFIIASKTIRLVETFAGTPHRNEPHKARLSKK